MSGLALDIGGHIGTITVALAIDNPDLRVIVVEPIPENLALIRLNCEANGIAERVTIVSGLAGRGGQGLIRYAFGGDETALHHAFIGNSSFAVPDGRHQAMRTHSWTLDELIGDRDVILAKIDCEGGEYQFLAACDPTRVLEWIGERHPNPMEGGPAKTRQDLLDLMPGFDVTFTGPEAGPEGFVAVRR